MSASSNSFAIGLMRKLDLTQATPDDLTIRRRRQGRGFLYLKPDNAPVRDPRMLRRFASLAVPPAYADVRLAENARAHLQAVGRDAAGRIQYRYHPEWRKVRESRKTRRLLRLARCMPRIRRALGRHLASDELTREKALAGLIELVASSAIRAGSESYARERGTRGAATLLKSNVSVDGNCVTLNFRAKGGQTVRKICKSRRLAAAIALLLQLPGRRLFQYRDADGVVRPLRRNDANRFLRDLAGEPISLKDFRTLAASAIAVDALTRTPPAESKRRRRSQVMAALRNAAEELDNTPTVCRKSYVNEIVVDAFECGILQRYSESLGMRRSPARREAVLAQVLARAAA
ncbi:MAG: DNA topoisomerase IB [Pseudorhodoplanes sp.]